MYGNLLLYSGTFLQWWVRQTKTRWLQETSHYLSSVEEWVLVTSKPLCRNDTVYVQHLEGGGISFTNSALFVCRQHQCLTGLAGQSPKWWCCDAVSCVAVCIGYRFGAKTMQEFREVYWLPVILNEAQVNLNIRSISDQLKIHLSLNWIPACLI